MLWRMWGQVHLDLTIHRNCLLQLSQVGQPVVYAKKTSQLKGEQAVQGLPLPSDLRPSTCLESLPVNWIERAVKCRNSRDHWQTIKPSATFKIDQRSKLRANKMIVFWWGQLDCQCQPNLRGFVHAWVIACSAMIALDQPGRGSNPHRRSRINMKRILRASIWSAGEKLESSQKKLESSQKKLESSQKKLESSQKGIWTTSTWSLPPDAMCLGAVEMLCALMDVPQKLSPSEPRGMECRGANEMQMAPRQVGVLAGYVLSLFGVCAPSSPSLACCRQGSTMPAAVP